MPTSARRHSVMYSAFAGIVSRTVRAFAVTGDCEDSGVTGAEPLADQADDILAAPYGVPVDRDDDVATADDLGALEQGVVAARTQAGVGARAPAFHAGDQRAVGHRIVEVLRERRGQVVRRDPDVGVRDAPVAQ